MKKEKSTSRLLNPTRKMRRAAFVAAVLFPFAIWMLIYMLLPLASIVMYSFTDAKMAYSDFSFIGLYQFVKAFGTKTIRVAIFNSLKASLFLIPVTLVLSMLLALGLNMVGEKYRNFCTFVYFMPNIMSMTAVCLVWKWLYHNQYGIFNVMLQAVGLNKVQFLTSEKTALISLCVIQVWSVIGYYAVLLLSAMRSIDTSIYEASDLDGANSFVKFFRITLPLMKNQLLFVCIMLTTAAFMFFTPVQLLCTDGTPGTSTLVMMVEIYNKGIQEGNLGYSSALSLILMMIILFFSLVQWVLTKEREPRVKHVPQIQAAAAEGGMAE